jgi:hypothetical protein
LLYPVTLPLIEVIMWKLSPCIFVHTHAHRYSLFIKRIGMIDSHIRNGNYFTENDNKFRFKN